MNERYLGVRRASIRIRRRMARVLFLREQAAPLSELLAERGFEPLHVALGTAVATGTPAPSSIPDAIVVTSAQAARFLGALPAGVPVHAVGPATADALREVGIESASVGEASGSALVRALDPSLSLWHVGGERIAAPLEKALEGRRVARWCVYRVVIGEGVADSLRAVLPVDAILFTSGAQVEAFAMLASPSDAHVVVLGDTAEAAAAAAGFRVDARATAPRLDALIDALATVCAAP
jgi:uroporphyrinogen-III synthase